MLKLKSLYRIFWLLHCISFLINKKLSEISERGIRQGIVYQGIETENANKINIRYYIKGNDINCEVRLIRRSELLHSATIAGTKNDFDGLAERIIEEMMKYAR